MAFSANMQAAIDAGAALFPAVEIDFPTGTERVSTHALATSTPGPFDPRLEGAGQVPRSARDRGCSLAAVRATLTYIDHDQKFRNRLGRGEKIGNVAVRIYMAAEGVAFADWFLEASGVLHQWDETDTNVWELSVTGDELSFSSQKPKVVTIYDFPNCPDAALGLQWPISGGRCSDDGDMQTGALTCRYVDSVNYRYLACWGWNDVLAAYHAGSIMSITSQYTVTHGQVGGYEATIIDRVSAPTGDVTVDLAGYDTNADGTGEPIIEATDVLAHVLSNFFLATYKRGSWLATHSLIDTDSFAAMKALLAYRAGGAAYVCNMQILSPMNGLELIDKWGEAMQVQPYWTRSGKLGLRLNSNPNTLGSASSTIRYPFDLIGNMRVWSNGDDCVQTAKVRFGQFAGKARYSLDASDPEATTTATEDLTLAFGPNTFP